MERKQKPNPVVFGFHWVASRVVLLLLKLVFKIPAVRRRVARVQGERRQAELERVVLRLREISDEVVEVGEPDATFMGRQVPLCICVGDVLYERLGFSRDGFMVLDDPNAESEPERGVFTLKDIFDIKYVVHKNAIYGKKVEA